MSLRDDFIAFDDRLAEFGVPPLTAWWRAGIGAWLEAYEHEQALELYACVGRGSSKSTALYKLATFFTLFAPFDIPPGERHYAILLSRLVAEAAKGVATIDAWLELLHVPHSLHGDVIDVEAGGQLRGIRVVAASVSAASGWRAYFVAKDERAKWPTAGVDELAGVEIDTSASAMTATHDLAPSITMSSAWGAFGEFYEVITAGSDAARVVLGPTPTWIAAPHVTEASTRRKERRPAMWAREYACQFSSSMSAIFDVETVDRMMAPRPESEKRLELVSTPVLITDPSGLARDRWTFAICKWMRVVRDLRDMYLYEKVWDPARNKEIDRRVHDANGPVRNPNWYVPEPFFVVSDIHSFERASHISPARAVQEIAAFALARGVDHVVSDQYGAFLLESEFARQGMRYASVNYTNESKGQALEWISEKARTNRLRIEPHAEMRKELLEFRERILPSGAVTYQGLKHDDFVSLLVTGAMADIHGLFHGSPTIGRPKGTGPRSTFGPGDFVEDNRLLKRPA